MRNISKFILLFFVAIPLVFAFGNQTVKQIDEIKNNTGTDILLNPIDKVDISYFSGEKALQSTVDGELEESLITNTELGYLTGLLSNAQDQIDSKAPNARLLNTTTPLQGGGDLSADRTLSILQAGAIQDGYLSSVDWNTFDGKQEAITGTDGDLYYYNSGLSNLGIGTTNQFLRVSALGFPEWVDLPPSVSVTTKGDIQTHNGTNPERLPVAINGKILSTNSATLTGLEWIDAPVSYITPTTTEGDLILRGSIEDERLPIGGNGQLLTSNGTTASWQDAPISLPDQTGNTGLYLKTNGTAANWNELNNDVNEIKDNLLECSGFDGCAPEGTITNGAGIDLSGTTTRTTEATAFNTSKLNLTQSVAGTLDYTYTKTANFLGKQMVAYCEIKTANTGVTFNSMIDGVVQSTLSVSSDNSWKYYKIPFVGGATSQSFKVDHVTAGEIPDIDIDNCFIGKDANQTREIGQAHFVGSLNYASANCVWTTNSISIGSFPVDSDCVSSNETGSVAAPDTKIPAVKITNTRTDGYYRLSVQGLLYQSNVTSGSCIFSTSNTGLYINQGISITEGLNSRADNTLIGDFRFDSLGDKQLEIIASSSNGTATCSVYATPTFPIKFTVHFYPDDTSTVVTQDTELTAKTANEINVKSSSISVLTTDYGVTGDYIVTDLTGGKIELDYSSLGLSVVPVIQAIGKYNIGISSDCNASEADNVTTTKAEVFFRCGGTGYSPSTINWSISKQGADVNKSATIVGKFENINSSDLHIVEAEKSATQNVSTSTFATVLFDNEIKDTGNIYEPSTGIATIKKDGSYRINAQAFFGTYTSTSTAQIDIIKNGNTTPIAQFQCLVNTTAFNWMCAIDRTLNLVVGDTINIRVWQNSGATRALSTSYRTFLNIEQLPDYESIIKNLSNQKTKCQTNFLSSNITTGGLVADWQFNNLTVGKRYSVEVSYHCYESNTSSNSKHCVVEVESPTKDFIDWHEMAVNPSNNMRSTVYGKKVITAENSVLRFNVYTLNNANIVAQSSGKFSTVKLCELPDTYVETTEF